MMQTVDIDRTHNLSARLNLLYTPNEKKNLESLGAITVWITSNMSSSNKLKTYSKVDVCLAVRQNKKLSVCVPLSLCVQYFIQTLLRHAAVWNLT